MTDKELTYNEIIKAWEVLDSWQQVALQNDDGTDTESPQLYEAIEIVREQINRQKAEIEQWQKNCDELYIQMNKRLKAELKIERRLAKAEAYKEFAKKVYDKRQRTVEGECVICEDDFFKAFEEFGGKASDVIDYY